MEMLEDVRDYSTHKSLIFNLFFYIGTELLTQKYHHIIIALLSLHFLTLIGLTDWLHLAGKFPSSRAVRTFSVVLQF